MPEAGLTKARARGREVGVNDLSRRVTCRVSCIEPVTVSGWVNQGTLARGVFSQRMSKCGLLTQIRSRLSVTRGEFAQNRKPHSLLIFPPPPPKDSLRPSGLLGGI